MNSGGRIRGWCGQIFFCNPDYGEGSVCSGASTYFKSAPVRPKLTNVILDPMNWDAPALDDSPGERPLYVSIGILAWNEEKSICPALESLFRQTLFGKLAQRNLRCEIVCVANGCTDGTLDIAAKTFADQSRRHPCREYFSCRHLDLKERGKINAWNCYVHQISAPGARFLFLMDADILINETETLWNMVAALEGNPNAVVATDKPCNNIRTRRRKSLIERLSLRAAQVTRPGEAKLCTQLYCIRASTARRIHLPKDLPACEDGFIKTVVCTDFLTREVNPARIMIVPGASHTFKGHTSLRGILRNHKRQMIGQAAIYVLVADYLQTLALSERKNLAVTLREKDHRDPQWLKRLIAEHVHRARFFWRLVPGSFGYRFKRLARSKGFRKITCLPATLAGFAVSMVSSFMAYDFLKRGGVSYWPAKSADQK
ncbi:MAG TPA: glycosyltransferase [Verrucomicrobiae bacterium]|nr:glycosyltransferase [Verrucomicrobiae bacterium]